MHLATALPGWTLVVIAAAIVALAVFAYRRARGLSTAQRYAAHRPSRRPHWAWSSFAC